MRFWCAFEIRRPSDGALIVASRQMLAVVQMPPGKPIRLPADWAVRYGHLKASTHLRRIRRGDAWRSRSFLFVVNCGYARAGEESCSASYPENRLEMDKFRQG